MINKTRACVTDLFHNYITAVNLSRQFVFHKRLKNHIVSFGLHFFVFLYLSFFVETTHFLSPIGCCLYFATHPAERWIPQDGCMAVISATDSSHTDTTLMYLHLSVARTQLPPRRAHSTFCANTFSFFQVHQVFSPAALSRVQGNTHSCWPVGDILAGR